MTKLRDASQIDSERRGQGIRLVGDGASAHLLGLLRHWGGPACRAAARQGETSSSCARGVSGKRCFLWTLHSGVEANTSKQI